MNKGGRGREREGEGGRGREGEERREREGGREREGKGEGGKEREREGEGGRSKSYIIAECLSVRQMITDCCLGCVCVYIYIQNVYVSCFWPGPIRNAQT